MTLKTAVFLAMAAPLFISTAALAAHGKAGLWSSTTTVTVPGVAPQAHQSTYCMTPAQVNSDAPVSDPRSGCAYSNVRVSGQTMTADMTCTGQLSAIGHFAATYDSPTHFTASIDIAGQGFNMTNKIDGHWVKDDCAGAQQ